MSPRKHHQYEVLLTKLDARIRDEVSHVVALIHEEVHVKPHLSAAPVHPADISGDAVDVDVQVLHAEYDLLEQIRLARERVADGTFGRCTRCQGEISSERLNALPYISLCVNCARAESTNGR